METHSDLLMDGEGAEVLEVAIAVVGGEGDQQEENTCEEGRQGLTIQKRWPRRRSAACCWFHQISDANPATITP